MVNKRTDRSDRVRVAVVGVGAVTSMGPTATDLWEGARDGRVAIEPVQNLDMRGFQTKLGGEVSTLVTAVGDSPTGGGAAGTVPERALELAAMAAREAIAMLPGQVPLDRLGLVLGTCNAGLLSAREWFRRDLLGEPADPLLARLVTPGGLADALAGMLDIAGPVLAVNTACASGANAIGLAADLIRNGRADAVLAGGTDALSDVVFAGFSALQALSSMPAAPYSGNRQGLSLGEGSGMLLLMSAALAEELNLFPLAEVAGYGLSADGYHTTAPRPDGSGAAQAIRTALRISGVHPTEVGYVNGHGTGTPKNDPAESRAISLALGRATSNLLVSSTKSMIGHLLGAAGAVEAIVTIGALAEQIAPPTAGYLVPDPDCPLDYVPNEARLINTDVALSNNFAFGGANASLVLSRPRARPAPPPAAADDVVVTGISVLSPAGTDVTDAWAAYRDGRAVHELFDGLRQGFVMADPEPYIGRRERRRMDRLGVLSVVSTAKALADAGLTPNTDEVVNCGVIFGTGVGPMEAMERFIRPLLTDPGAPGDPGVFPNTVYNQAAGQVALHLGLCGPTSTLSVGHSTGAATLGYAADLIRAGHADMLVATSTDTLTPPVARAYAANGLASRRLAGSADDGRFALAEGSVSLVLESRSAALRRGARPLGTIAGFGLSSDGGPAIGGTRGGNERAIRAAIGAAGLQPGDIGDVWLAAAGHRSTDFAEAEVLTTVFGPAVRPNRHAPKIPLGEPMGVGGALCAALAICNWRDRNPTPALINTMSLTGSNACLVI
ncbi:MAG: beta-ketoacyl-[acyl-carrier-protein] synthase family protein, partial [Nakamurella sp.]